MAGKTRLLFVIGGLSSGGAEKSLISLLTALDDDRFQIFLQVFSPKGLFDSLVPSHVSRLAIPGPILTLTSPVRESIPMALRHPAVFFRRLQAAFHIRTHRLSSRRQVQSIWKWWKHAIHRDPAHYDIAIGYLQTTPLYYVVDKVDASRKIGWIHSDYMAAGYDPEIDRHYFEHLDDLAIVTEANRKSFLQSFPEMAAKTHVIPNLISAKSIRMLAESGQGFTDRFAGVRILTIARLAREKGIDMAVEACAILVNRGLPVKWYVIGKGTDLETLQKQISDAKLSGHFILLGEAANPYPFIRESDIYVQPSRYEGKCIALEEAKALCKPLVATAYDSVADQIEDGVTGLVAEMNCTGLANAIGRLLSQPGLRKELSAALASQLNIDDKTGFPKEFLEMIGFSG